jgi:hypothetical protein
MEIDELGEAFEKSVKLMCNFGIGTMTTEIDGQEVTAAYLLVMHDSFPIPLTCVLSMQMADNVIEGLSVMKPQITLDSVTIAASDTGDSSVH